ncbi:hypothetical protein Tco_0829246 [Tanacetum coccineum]
MMAVRSFLGITRIARLAILDVTLVLLVIGTRAKTSKANALMTMLDIRNCKSVWDKWKCVPTAPAEGNGNGINATAADIAQRRRLVPIALMWNVNSLAAADVYEETYTELQTELDRTKEKLENYIIKKEKE